MTRGLLTTWVIVAALTGVGLGVYILQNEVAAGTTMIVLSLVLIGLSVSLIRTTVNGPKAQPQRQNKIVHRTKVRTEKRKAHGPLVQTA